MSKKLSKKDIDELDKQNKVTSEYQKQYDDFKLKFNKFHEKSKTSTQIINFSPKTKKLNSCPKPSDNKIVKHYYVGMQQLNINYPESKFYLMAKKFFKCTVQNAFYRIMGELSDIVVRKNTPERKILISVINAYKVEKDMMTSLEIFKIQEILNRNIVIINLRDEKHVHKYNDNRRTIVFFLLNKKTYPIVGINKKDPFTQHYDFDAKEFKSIYLKKSIHKAPLKFVGIDSINPINIIQNIRKKSSKFQNRELLGDQEDRGQTSDQDHEDKADSSDQEDKAKSSGDKSSGDKSSGDKSSGDKSSKKTGKKPKTLKVRLPPQKAKPPKWLTFNQMDNNQNLPSIEIKINNKGESDPNGTSKKLYLGGEINGYHTLYDVDSSLLSGNIKVVGKIYFTQKKAKLCDIFWIKEYLRSLKKVDFSKK